MVEQYIQTEFQQILDEYGMEAMVYAFRFEQQITALEKRLHSSEDPEEIGKETIIAAMNFYDGDWCGIIEGDLEMEAWYPVLWHDKATGGMTATHFHELEDEAFNSFELEDLSYLNVWDRHIEQSDLREPTLHERAVEAQESVEDIVIRNLQNEKVHNAIGMLPEVQKRRIKMYFFDGMTYEEIAAREKCKHPAVVKSVKTALDKLKNILEE